ncbi:hypothetical protein BKA65DRAFT_471794 [Rhexocercosporidium sp. MPI-PUGE-AT-0058]|nr:hypothetical protein BKA65DRAFT_471794 [Rhexocercosporidium sp. MPI-PUGE-AT-0058]
MPPKFAWPFKKVPDDEEQQRRNLPKSLPRPTKERKPRLPAPPPIITSSESHTQSQPRPNPGRILWTQLTLRTISLLASMSALTIAIYVAIGPVGTQRAWPVVFVSSTFTLLLSLLEALFHLRPFIPIPIRILKIPRLHPIAIIIADLLAVCLSIWSFLVLFLEVWEVRRGGDGGGGRGGRGRMGEGDVFCMVEMWIAVGVGFIHALLFAFDCIDCCSARSPNSRVNELGYRKKRRGTSGVGEDVIEMDWG